MNQKNNRGFSFVEILFAIIILGIGFIMVAAIFPVAIQQSRMTSDEVAGASLCRESISVITQIARGSDDPLPAPATNTTPLFPATDLFIAAPQGQATVAAKTSASPIPKVQFGAAATFPASLTPPGKVLSFYDARLDNTGVVKYQDNLWNGIRGNVISSNNPEYAWVGMYRRNTTYTANVSASGPTPIDDTSGAVIKNTSPGVLQIYVIAVRAQATSTFTADDVTVPAGGGVPNLCPRSIQVQIAVDPLTGLSLVAISKTFNAADVPAAIEGAYLIISDDHITSPDGTPIKTPPLVTPSNNRGWMNGRIYKLGSRRADLDSTSSIIYELQAGNEFAIDGGPNGTIGEAGLNNDDVAMIGGNSGNITTSGLADAFIVGRGYADPKNPSAGYAGGCMAIGSFTSFVPVN